MNNRLDPLAAAKGIEATYKRYLKTLLAPREPALASAFDRAVDESTLLTNGPLLELTPPYAPGASLAELVSDGTLHPDFSRLHSAALPIHRPLYVHQEKAIRKVVAGRNLVVSTGTGSGKTESFLVPILNSLISEKARGTLGPGVRALLLYPMNALANDQLKRLRSLLANVPEITFGRYTGETEETRHKASNDYEAANPGQDRLSNELLSREEMRESPPHILLTNYAMLEYLLLRPVDLDLFDGEHAGTWRFIALDEAHVYDGAQGAEVALLLRRLKERVGAARPLQCIATSASLTGRTPESQGQESTAFARNLFDAPFEYIDGQFERQDLVTPTRRRRHELPSWELGDEQFAALRTPGDDLALLSKYASGRDVATSLQGERHLLELQSALARGPVAIDVLQQKLWPDSRNGAENLQVLVALGSKVKDASGHPVLSARYHMFVRATEGAYVAFNKQGPKVLLGRHEIDPESGRAMFEFGTCQRCGAVHLAGEHIVVKGREYFRPAKKDGVVHWLVVTDQQADSVMDEDEMTLAADGDPSVATNLRHLCAGCGALGSEACSESGCPGGPILRVREHSKTTRVMSKCTECGARSRQVIRRLRTDTNAAPAVLTTEMYQHIPAATDETVEEVGEGRKLLMFSDSRQNAAFAAPYLERTYGRVLERRYITTALTDPRYRDEELSPEDLADFAGAKAKKAYHFDDSATRVAIKRVVSPWVMAEMMALDQRQSLEGLGLMAVWMSRPRNIELPPAFARLGLTDDETWGLLDELLKIVRLQGAITLLDEVDIQDEIFEPRNTTVRIRLMSSDATKRIISWLPGGVPGTTNNRLLYGRKVLAAVGSDMPVEKLLDGCWRFLTTSGYLRLVVDKSAGDVYQVDHEKLRLQSGEAFDWFQCSACRRLSIHNVRGVCPHGACGGSMEPFDVPRVEIDSHHYRNLYRTMRPAPLSAREHTAQWAAKAAAQIQRDFIEGKINVLSCSTTFELGVDVGDLQSVVLRNMPPKTANYVQRAGRAGRRAASAALVLTYAKRSSHDLSKYQNPVTMISGEMRIPWIPIDNERIARRHAHSVALAAYFRNRFENENQLTWKHAGEFFSPSREGDDSPAAQVRQFLTPLPPGVESSLRQILTPQVARDIGVDDGSWVHILCDLLFTAEQEICNDIKTYRTLVEEAKAANKLTYGARLIRTLETIEKRPLLGYLANKNILPKYGFPVDTVDLRTIHCESDVGRRLELSRDLSQAIYDYAPGNQVVAGGKLWTSGGLHKLPKRELVELKYRTCRACDQFQCGTSLDFAEVCPSCQQDFGAVRTFVVPEFGFVADRRVEDVRPEPPERRWGGNSYVESLGDVSDTFSWQSTGGVEVCARAGTRARMVVISDGGGPGFHLCGRCGWAAPVASKNSRRKHRVPATGKSCEGIPQTVSLAHRYETDIAEFTFSSLDYDKHSESRWLSVLYALLEGASEALEISRDDIDGTLSWTSDGRRSIVLFDTVPAGAGATKQIAENLERVLQFAVARVTKCDCGEETSCYGCLRSFKNDWHHDKLSRARAREVFDQLNVTGLASPAAGPWGETLAHTSQAVTRLMTELAARGLPKPEIGIDVGKYWWPVEAVWQQQGVILVDGGDVERDTDLAASGYTVVDAAEATAEQVAALVASSGH